MGLMGEYMQIGAVILIDDSIDDMLAIINRILTKTMVHEFCSSVLTTGWLFFAFLVIINFRLHGRTLKRKQPRAQRWRKSGIVV